MRTTDAMLLMLISICLSGCGTREYERGAIGHVYSEVVAEPSRQTVAVVPCPDDVPGLVSNVPGGLVSISVDRREFQEWWGINLPGNDRVMKRLNPEPVISNETGYQNVMRSYMMIRDLLEDPGVLAGLDQQVIEHCTRVLGDVAVRLMDAIQCLAATDIADVKGHDIWKNMASGAKNLQDAIRCMAKMSSVGVVEQKSSADSESIVESGDLLVAAVQQHRASLIVNALRGVERSLDRWESNSLPALVAPGVRSEVRSDVARVLISIRIRLIDCARTWRNNLLPMNLVPQPDPVVLFD